MKTTYKQVVEKPRVEVWYDQFADNPRRDDQNLGYFFTKEDKYQSPDGNSHQIYGIMVETGETASNEQNHIVEMTRRINNETGEKVKAIYPVYRYEHGNVVYKRGTAKGFDISNCGFYIVTEKSYANIGAVPEGIEKCIDDELKKYTKWANGEVYGITLYDENGEVQDSCGQLFSFEDMHAGLPTEFAKAYSVEDLQKLLE